MFSRSICLLDLASLSTFSIFCRMLAAPEVGMWKFRFLLHFDVYFCVDYCWVLLSLYSSKLVHRKKIEMKKMMCMCLKVILYMMFHF